MVPDQSRFPWLREQDTARMHFFYAALSGVLPIVISRPIQSHVAAFVLVGAGFGVALLFLATGAVHLVRGEKLRRLAARSKTNVSGSLSPLSHRRNWRATAWRWLVPILVVAVWLANFLLHLRH